MESDKQVQHIYNNAPSAAEQPGVIIPIGSIIQAELKRQGRSVTWFSSRIHCDRRNIYDIFRRDNIDTALLMRISTALRVDFFKVFSDALAQSGVKEHPGVAGNRM